MLKLKSLGAILVMTCFMSANAHASNSVTTTIGGVMMGLSVVMDMMIDRDTKRLEKDYIRTEMVVVGYQIDKTPCRVCTSSVSALCFMAEYTARLRNEFEADVHGTHVTKQVLSESLCAVDENDANATATRRFPIGTRTTIWYKKTNPSIWEAADGPTLAMISSVMFYTGGAAFVYGVLARQLRAAAGVGGQ